ncbi:M56 family metallopeptidase [Sphingomonas sp. MMS24-JH45]
MLAVLLVRGPVRRAFGPELAYALWAIPALRLLLPPLPAAWREQAAAPIPDTFASMSHQASALIVPYVDVPPAMPGVEAVSPFATFAPAALLLWGAGAAGLLLWQLARYWRFRVELMRAAVPLDRDGPSTSSRAMRRPARSPSASSTASSPSRAISPSATTRARKRALALAHELGHHRRGDLIANWAALAVLALHWFNPIAWLAYRAFRADQEMANDAGVIARLGPGAARLRLRDRQGGARPRADARLPPPHHQGSEREIADAGQGTRVADAAGGGRRAGRVAVDGRAGADRVWDAGRRADAHEGRDRHGRRDCGAGACRAGRADHRPDRGGARRARGPSGGSRRAQAAHGDRDPQRRDARLPGRRGGRLPRRQPGIRPPHRARPAGAADARHGAACRRGPRRPAGSGDPAGPGRGDAILRRAFQGARCRRWWCAAATAGGR